MQVFLPRQTTFYTQTVMIDTFAQKPMHGADQTADKKPLTWVEARKKVV